MKNKKKLFEFLGQLIETQIKKYATLTTEQMVRDARYNAKLIFSEINELLGFAEQLLIDMEQESPDPHLFAVLFDQIKFYLEQEYSRAYAGWILDEHNSTAAIEKQLALLQQIGKTAEIDCSSASIAKTPTQELCEYDTAQIVFQVFDQGSRYLVKDSGTSQSPKSTRQRAKLRALDVLVPLDFESPSGLKICAPQ